MRIPGESNRGFDGPTASTVAASVVAPAVAAGERDLRGSRGLVFHFSHRHDAGMKRGLIVIAVLAALAIAVRTVFGGGSSYDPVSGCTRQGSDSRLSLAEAERFRQSPLFYLGDRFAGLPLTAVLCDQTAIIHQAVAFGTPTNSSVMPSWGFVYGTCEGADVFDGSGCAPPIEVQNDGSCWRNPSVNSQPPQITHLRGVSVGIFPGDRVEVYTRTTTVTVFAPSLTEQKQIVRALQSVDGRYSPGSALPPATAHTLTGKTTCPSAINGQVAHGR